MGNVLAMYLLMEDSISPDYTNWGESADINYIYCGFAELNLTTYQPFFPPEKINALTSFPTMVKNNDSIKVLLSIGKLDGSDAETFARMALSPDHRKSFINTSIELAKKYNYNGFELHWLHPSTEIEMTNFGLLVKEWREAIGTEYILVATVYYSPLRYDNNVISIYPCIDMSSSLDWINVAALDFYTPESSPHRTGPSQAFLNPNENSLSGKFGLERWIKVFPAEKIVFSYATYGWAWKLKDPNENGFFASADGPSTDTSPNGFIEYALYNRDNLPYESSLEFYVNYFSSGNTWITTETAPVIKPDIVVREYGALGNYFYYFRSSTSSTAFINKGLAEWKKLKEGKKVSE